ncbi:hypothetical protein IM774_08545 [Erysipelotrichaceae bacterium RD49]|nr:hypothetical protein [Erysipelotrichaceae bacterium RD49]
MAFYSLWILGILILALSIIFLYKQAVSLKKSFSYQQNFMKLHPQTVKASFDQGWLFLDILLAFFVLSFGSQSLLGAGENGFSPETLCFLGIAIWLASKAIARWNDGRILFYKQGLVYHTDDIPYSTIRSLEKYGGSQYELTCKKGKFMISRREGEEIERAVKEWKQAKRRK